ncbi:MAG: patatin-like phospholipase family protein [Cytophagales bacterium]|nr:patatin-like phospholipase family protein [Bernardetiaceae bacterium]MDW8205320.1 patatin-like phospholipase family protein [Cytophagales bacterium]
MKQNKKVALVLSSGGSRGLAQAGAIQALEENGFQIASVVGSSIGAVIGGVYAMGQLETYTNWIKTLNKRDVWGLMDFTLAPHGLIKGEKVFEKMKMLIPDMPIEQMHIPYAAVATDILNEQEVVFTRGSFYEAARASIAIPAVITPVKFGNTFLVDGGVLNPVPIEHVPRTGDELLVVINLYGEPLTKTAEKNIAHHQAHYQTDLTDANGRFSINGFINRLSRLTSSADKQSLGYYSLLTASSSAMVRRMAQLTIARHRHEIDILVNIPADSAGTFEFFKASELMELGKELMSEAIATYKQRCIMA